MRPDECDIDSQVAKEALAGLAQNGQGFRPHCAAETEYPNPARSRERLADAEVVGDRGKHGGTAVKDHARAGMKRRSRRKPNRFLFWPVKFSRDRGLRLEG